MRANIDKFLNGELMEDKDVVLWYGAHFTHDQKHGGNSYHRPQYQTAEVVNPTFNSVSLENVEPEDPGPEETAKAMAVLERSKGTKEW